MEFIQIIDMKTTNADEILKLDQQWRKATDGKRTLRRSIVGRDRNDPDHVVVLAFFDDYSSAMVNSALPETNDFVQKQTAFLDAPPNFVDLDVIEDES
jgi:hypothetical protein